MASACIRSPAPNLSDGETVLIVLEGPDWSGKSTIAEELANKHGFAVWHKGPIEDEVSVEYVQPIIRFSHNTMPRRVVCDRWHLGEMIYGPILRGESKVSLQQAEMIDQLILNAGGILVYVDQPLGVLERRAEKRPDDLVYANYLPAIRSFYESYRAKHTYWERFSNLRGDVSFLVDMAS